MSMLDVSTDVMDVAISPPTFPEVLVDEIEDWEIIYDKSKVGESLEVILDIVLVAKVTSKIDPVV